MISRILFLVILFFTLNVSTAQSGDYFGMEPPGLIPKVFAPGILSPEDQIVQEPIFSSDGTILFYTARIENEYVTMYMIKKENKWSKPLGPLYIHNLKVRYPCVSYDGEKLFFVYTEELIKDGEKSYNSDIYCADIIAPGEFGKPQKLGESINTSYNERHPSITKSGTLYFYSDREDGFGNNDIYRSRKVDGNFMKAENIGESVNSAGNEYNPFISADESFIIFNTQDLHISFRNEEGSWSEKINMGDPLNTNAVEAKGVVSPDDKYLFFSSSRSGKSEIYWVSTKIIEQLREQN